MKLVVIVLIMMALWLSGLTILEVRRELVGPSNSQVLCTDALERRSNTQKVLTSQLTSSSADAYEAWYVAHKRAETEVTKDENDVNRFCGTVAP